MLRVSARCNILSPCHDIRNEDELRRYVKFGNPLVRLLGLSLYALVIFARVPLLLLNSWHQTMSGNLRMTYIYALRISRCCGGVFLCDLFTRLVHSIPLLPGVETKDDYCRM